MRNFFYFILMFLVFSCAHKAEDPLTIPPNFAEVPDPSKPEQPTVQQKEENVAKLKELLLESE